MSEIIENTKYKILTPEGFKDFSGILLSKQDCYRIDFSDGTFLECSLNHPLKIKNGYIRRAFNLKIGDEIETKESFKTISSIKEIGYKDCADILNVNTLSHLYYTNDLVSHNCFLGSSATLFDTSVIAKYKEEISNSDLNYTLTKLYDSKIKVWKNPIPGHAYIMGVDASDGSGGDNSTLCIFDVSDIRNIEQVVAFNSREININSFALLAATLGARYNTALISGERNGIGAGFFDTLTGTFEYSNTVNYKNKNEAADRPGIYSTNGNKIDACLWTKTITTLSNDSPEIAKIIIRESNIVFEMEYFVSKTLSHSVTYSASRNNHDDYIMSFIWAMFALKLEISDNYFDIKSTQFTSSGIEIPLTISPIIDPDYSEQFIQNKLNFRSTITNKQTEKTKEDSQISIIRDQIYNEILGRGYDDDSVW